MTATAMEVAAIFRIKDEATLTIKRISDAIKALSGEMKALSAEGKSLSESFKLTFTTMDAGVVATTKEVSALAAEWAKVGTAAAKAGSVSATSGGAGAGGARGGRRLGGGAALIAAGAAIYSVDEALKVSDIVSKSLASVYPEGLPSNSEALKAELTKKIIDEARIVRLPLQIVAKMALDEIKTNANQPWESRMKMIPQVIEGSAREAYASRRKTLMPLRISPSLADTILQSQRVCWAFRSSKT